MWQVLYSCYPVSFIIFIILAMKADKHEDSVVFFFFFQGGALWFQNLTEYPHGVLGSIFPLLIAGLHYTNVQVHKLYFVSTD